MYLSLDGLGVEKQTMAIDLCLEQVLNQRLFVIEGHVSLKAWERPDLIRLLGNVGKNQILRGV